MRETGDTKKGTQYTKKIDAKRAITTAIGDKSSREYGGKMRQVRGNYRERNE